MMLNKCNMLEIDDVENASDGRNKYGLNKYLTEKSPVNPSKHRPRFNTYKAASRASLLDLPTPLLALHV
jgi:hypothetical protein